MYFVAVALTASELVSGPDGSGNKRSTVYSVAKSGGTPVPIAGPIAGGDPAVDGRSVYWVSVPDGQGYYSTSTSIMRTDRDGTTTRLAAVTGYVERLAFFENRLYWVASGFHGAEYICVACDTPSIVQSKGSGDLAPMTEVTLAAGALIHDAIIDPTGLWLSLEGTRSGVGVDYPPNDDHTGALVHVPAGGAPATVLTGLPFTSDLSADDTTVFATGDTTPQLVAK